MTTMLYIGLVSFWVMATVATARRVAWRWHESTNAEALVNRGNYSYRGRPHREEPDGEQVGGALFWCLLMWPIMLAWWWMARPGACVPREVRDQRAYKELERELERELEEAKRETERLRVQQPDEGAV